MIILPGTTISDCWKAYNCLESEEFKHLTVNHSYDFINPKTGVHINTIEQQWREVKQRASVWKEEKPLCGTQQLYSRCDLKIFKKRLQMFIKEAAKLYPPPS